EPPEGGAAFAKCPLPSTIAASPSDTSAATPPPSSSSCSTPPPPPPPQQSLKPRFLATIQHIPKNPSVLKSGYLYTPDDTHTQWIRRFVELRLPYLHIHSVPDGDEINAINLRNARVDHEPEIVRLLVEGSS